MHTQASKRSSFSTPRGSNFVLWTGLHRQLNVNTTGLPEITEELAEIFDEVYNRFLFIENGDDDDTAALVFDGAENLYGYDPKSPTSDVNLFHDAISTVGGWISNPVDHLDSNGNKLVAVRASSWRVYYETILEFIHSITKQPKFVIASALYILQCDEFAAGLYNVEDENDFVDTYLAGEYQWALSFRTRENA